MSDEVLDINDVLPPEPDVQAPPKREDRPAEEPQADKPKARTTTAGKPEGEKRKRGRPRKTESAKTQAPPRDYTSELTGLGDAAWLTASQFAPAAPYAAVFHAAQPQIVSALNTGAKTNAQLRGYLDKAADGGGNLWMIQLAAIGVQIGMQGLELARNAEMRKQVANANAASVAEYLKANGLIADQPEQQPQEAGEAQ